MAVIWVTFLIVTFVVIGLRRGSSGGGRQALVVATSALTLLTVYLTLGRG